MSRSVTVQFSLDMIKSCCQIAAIYLMIIIKYIGMEPELPDLYDLNDQQPLFHPFSTCSGTSLLEELEAGFNGNQSPIGYPDLKKEEVLDYWQQQQASQTPQKVQKVENGEMSTEGSSTQNHDEDEAENGDNLQAQDSNYEPLEQDSGPARRKDKRRKHRAIHRESHVRYKAPTKNFLPAFKNSMLGFIRSKLKDDCYFNSVPIVRRILDHPKGQENKDKSKKPNNNISRNDYKQLFKVERFRPILEKYFACRQHYRDLMNSGVSATNRKEYFKRIHVFEMAFRSGVFDRISGCE